MIVCSIKGCKESCANNGRNAHRWIILRACKCGAQDLGHPRSCTCAVDPACQTPTSYWPNLDWWALGGVDEIVLCPAHKFAVYDEIIKQRAQDPSMNPGGGQDPSNRH